ncbi:MAG: hypothetical protein EOO89_27965 [Pedobacter sp.]|nr:MAG: hypothetical protein EOO89_27965 [Pedobacter sp.]
MKHVVFSILWLLFLGQVFGQKVVNKEPYVNMDFRKILYVNYDNPVYISTGKYGALNVAVNNGTIKKTTKAGKYIIKPKECRETIVTLTGPGFRRQIQ